MANWYVAPTGSATGFGTIASPWKLQTAFGGGNSHGTVQHDDTVWLRGGVYSVQDTDVVGTDPAWSVTISGTAGTGVDNANGKIIFRNYNGERAIIDLTLTGVKWPDNIRFLNSSSDVSYVWLWGLEVRCTFPDNSRTTSHGGPTNLSQYLQSTNGLKWIHCIVHDGSGGALVDSDSGRHEIYGCIFYNHGYAVTSNGGGGHHIYLHHTDNGNQDVLNVEGNCLFNDEGIAMQMYTASGDPNTDVRYIDFKNNVVFNSGVLNGTSVGGLNAKSCVVGGSGATNHINFTGNYGYWPDGYGDVFLQVCQQLVNNIGTGIVVQNNYNYGGGSGFGTLWIAGTLGSGGTLTVNGNTFRVPASSSTSKGKLVTITESGGGGYSWGNPGNTYYRNPGTSTAPDGCNDGGSDPLAFKDPSSACHKLADFLTACSFSGSGDAIFDDPTSPSKGFVIPTDRFEAGRGLVVYYNYHWDSRVGADLSAITTLQDGDLIVAHDVRDVWGTPVCLWDAASGGTRVIRYKASSPTVYFPAKNADGSGFQRKDPVMSGSHYGSGSETAPPMTAPFFNAFLVRHVTCSWD